jgi:Protein of unknown function (DUF4240)
MSTDEFWRLIDTTKVSKREVQLRKLTAQLKKLSRKELIAFHRKFIELQVAAFTWDLWFVAWLFKGQMLSDDSFSDFRNWLISRGKDVYERGLRDPDSLLDELRKAEHPEFEEFGYVADHVFDDRFNEDFPAIKIRFPKAPAGGEWLRAQAKKRKQTNLLNECQVFYQLTEQDYLAIAKQFPRTWSQSDVAVQFEKARTAV